MCSCFLLDNPEEAGFDPVSSGKQRHKLDYLRLLRGWMFDADSQEGAVMKGWVESRFGLVTRNHSGPTIEPDSEAFLRFTQARVSGLYNTNGLEAQLDLLFAYCQYELTRRKLGSMHLTLYRGVNRLNQHEVLWRNADKELVLLLNNLNSFTDDLEYAGTFGDYILRVSVPLTKLLFFPGLLPGVLRGEGEYLVLGGVYRVSWSTL